MAKPTVDLILADALMHDHVASDISDATTAFVRKINDPDTTDMGYEQSSSADGVTAEYITDKLITNSRIGSNANTSNGGNRIDTTQDPDTFETYLRSARNSILYDLTTEDGDFRHTPLSQQIYVWRGDSVVNGLNGRPVVSEYSASMGAYPPPRVINGGSF